MSGIERMGDNNRPSYQLCRVSEFRGSPLLYGTP